MSLLYLHQLSQHGELIRKFQKTIEAALVASLFIKTFQTKWKPMEPSDDAGKAWELPIWNTALDDLLLV